MTETEESANSAEELLKDSWAKSDKEGDLAERRAMIERLRAHVAKYQTERALAPASDEECWRVFHQVSELPSLRLHYEHLRYEVRPQVLSWRDELVAQREQLLVPASPALVMHIEIATLALMQADRLIKLTSRWLADQDQMLKNEAEAEEARFLEGGSE